MVRGKCKFVLHEKQDIVTEAYRVPNNIRPTARKYEVAAKSIRAWKIQLDLARANMLPAEFQKKMRSKKKTLHPGQTAIGFDHDDQLHAYFKNLQQQGRAVSIRLLCAEYKQLRADNVELPNKKIVQQQIYRWMRHKRRVTNQLVTHQLQNTQYNEGLMKD